jgi:hypothetical protein
MGYKCELHSEEYFEMIPADAIEIGRPNRLSKCHFIVVDGVQHLLRKVSGGNKLNRTKVFDSEEKSICTDRQK